MRKTSRVSKKKTVELHQKQGSEGCLNVFNNVLLYKHMTDNNTVRNATGQKSCGFNHILLVHILLV